MKMLDITRQQAEYAGDIEISVDHIYEYVLIEDKNGIHSDIVLSGASYVEFFKDVTERENELAQEKALFSSNHFIYKAIAAPYCESYWN